MEKLKVIARNPIPVVVLTVMILRMFMPNLRGILSPIIELLSAIYIGWVAGTVIGEAIHTPNTKYIYTVSKQSHKDGVLGEKIVLIVTSSEKVAGKVADFNRGHNTIIYTEREICN